MWRGARFVLLKFGRLIATLLIVTFLTTALLSLVPGDPAVVMAGEAAASDPKIIAAINKQYGFNESVVQRYLDWVGNALHGDLGTSYFTKQPVIEAIKTRLPVTLELALLSTMLAIVVAIP